ncbi:MAG: arginase family protein [Candidatus Caenarcaniphilales bacterium]|nr:arginase family protein [Candidatus Caenarcaniphilales bacterium]
MQSRRRLDFYESPELDIIVCPWGFGGTDNLAQEGAHSILGDTELVRALESLKVKVNLIEPPSLGPFEIQEDQNRIRNIEAITSVNHWLREQVYLSRGIGHMPLVLGGDASLSIASISALSKYYREQSKTDSFGVLWFSNHFGNSSPEVTKSWNANRMALTALSYGDSHDKVHEDFRSLISAPDMHYPIVNKKNIVQLGINHRSAQENVEHEYLVMEDLMELGIAGSILIALEKLSHCEHIHVVLDLNVFDLSAVSNYSLGQMNYREAISLARTLDLKLRRMNKLSSIDVVEHCPSREAWDKRGEASEWVVDILENIFGANVFNVARKY